MKSLPLRLVLTAALVLQTALLVPTARAEPTPPTPPPAYEEPPNTLAWVSLVSGGAFLATGIGFGVAAVVEHRLARDIEERAQDDEDLSSADQTSYTDAIDTRDDLRVVSGVTAGAGLGLFVFAGILFARDASVREERAPGPSPAAVSATPWLGPGLAGGVARVAF